MDSTKERFIAEYIEAYPEKLTGVYDILECLQCAEGSETLLAASKADGKKVVIKCYNKTHPLFCEEDAGLLAHLEHPFIPGFVEEWENETSRKEDGSVFLIDFGISRTFAEDKGADTIWCGTREYAASEQYGYM